VKHEEELLNHDKQEFLKQYKHLAEFQHQSMGDVSKARRHEEILGSLHEQGIIDEVGRPVTKRKQ
jgi:hypothetical protein